MADTDYQLRLDQLRTALAQSGDRRSIGAKASQTVGQGAPVSGLEREEGSASVVQPVLLLASKQRHGRAAALVDFRPDQDKAGLGPALGLSPGIDTAAAVV
jgi:hypothetical protein